MYPDTFKSLFSAIVFIFPAKFPTFAPFLWKVALSKKPNTQTGQEAESWKNQAGGVMIPENTMAFSYAFMQMSAPFECFQNHGVTHMGPCS